MPNFLSIPSVPSNRYTPLKHNWEKIYTPIVEHLKLQVRFNLQTRNVEIKTCEETKTIGKPEDLDVFKVLCLQFLIWSSRARVLLGPVVRFYLLLFKELYRCRSPSHCLS